MQNIALLHDLRRSLTATWFLHHLWHRLHRHTFARFHESHEMRLASGRVEFDGYRFVAVMNNHLFAAHLRRCARGDNLLLRGVGACLNCLDCALTRANHRAGDSGLCGKTHRLIAGENVNLLRLGLGRGSEHANVLLQRRGRGNGNCLFLRLDCGFCLDFSQCSAADL